MDDREGDPRRKRYEEMADDALLRALRRFDPLAFEVFIRRYQPGLLLQARRARVPPADREVWVLEVLHDAVLTLTATDRPVAKPLAAYLTTALYHKVAWEFREAARRARRDGSATEHGAGDAELAILDACSAHSVRAARGPDWDAPKLSPALARLAQALDEGLTEDERQLLNWLSAFVPHRTIAEWLGISLAATSQRAFRLCRRLREAARRFSIAQLDERDRLELRRFFRRVEALAEADGHAGEGSGGAGRS